MKVSAVVVPRSLVNNRRGITGAIHQCDRGFAVAVGVAIAIEVSVVIVARCLANNRREIAGAIHQCDCGFAVAIAIEVRRQSRFCCWDCYCYGGTSAITVLLLLSRYVIVKIITIVEHMQVHRLLCDYVILINLSIVIYFIFHV